jgi:predicted DNA binding CopG/RHH family protein
MTAKLKKIPRFKDEAEERRFWENHDSTDYVDWSKARRASFPNLKLSTTSISLRLPQAMLDRIKVEANRRDVPYQSLIKVWLNEKLDADIPRRKRAGRRTAA